MKRILSIILSLGISILSYSQEIAPTIKGKVKISINEGTFDCDLTISNIPKIKDYLIRLNSGMNLLHIKSKKPNEFILVFNKSDKDSTSTGESSAYYFADNTGKGKFLPHELQFRYVGKFPIANDTIENYSRQDWKGNIAFNGFSVRTDGSQSAWYPYIYDAEKDISYEKMYYDIDFECVDCATIYINGNKPVKSPKTILKSEQPYELTLFCGKYDYVDNGDLILLNPKFSKQDIQDFSNTISQFKQFYENKIKVKFTEPPIFVNTTPTSKNNGWLFVSYPTIMGIGWGNDGLGALFEKENQKWYKQFIAHELGHYYFGTYKVSNSELGDMISEGFAEYLSLKLTEEILGKELYNKKLEEKFKNLQDFKTLPISKIKSIKVIEDRQTFVYDYAPIVFIAIEKEIGNKKMWAWINKILNTNTNFTNYDFLVSTLRNTLNNEKKIQQIIAEYFDNDNSTENAIKKSKNK
ncbi:hypothetical protein SAMN05421780_105154 [Flexibacter flexilis DSM 6793]|uniref:Peptidase M1 membrane alanine aminopeptidase domain-containing protein n=1 Tax=Flexibacter flexilis DSM 6793 TaxID=927664 RepID=A0A1I1J036_9BACT|nr:hypothetical protein [Flexibacter flexilis]SFC41874.1 hypothetical protein SAMN05421780_105154 [Flexibacter flexilis DSM 6793]